MIARKASFDPVVTPDTRVLILGSLPGEASLAAGRYYANPRNQFWHLIGGVLGTDVFNLAYEERLACLLDCGVGLWDSIGTATRSGSLDAAIRHVSANALVDLARSLPQLRAIAFNGAKSAAIGQPLLAGEGDIALIRLPSSSPAHAKLSFEGKLTQWSVLGKYVAPTLQS